MKKLVHIFFIGVVFLAPIYLRAQWSLSGNNVTATQYLGTVAGDTDPLVIKTNNVERMRITSAGNIGVGTITPAYKLDVKSNKVRVASNTFDGITFEQQSWPSQGTLLFSSDRTGYTFTIGNKRQSDGNILPIITMYDQGNVGIGTITPAYKLDVKSNKVRVASNTFDGITFEQQSWPSQGTLLFSSDRTGYTFTIGNKRQSDGNILPIITMYDQGNVGIGTTNPGTYKLAVEGKLGARQIVVTQSAWADFVFQDHYRLKPLHEVEKFIKENKHLPDVPSEKDVLKDGVNLGAMDAVLLQKIEEMTLYIIDLKKQVDSQAQELLKLKNEKSAEFSSSMNK